MKQKSILVLDDADLAYAFEIALKKEGLSIISFTKALLALEYFKTNSNNFFR